MRGEAGPPEGCALRKLRVDTTSMGRCKLASMHGMLTGAGKLFNRSMAVWMVVGLAVLAAASTHGCNGSGGCGSSPPQAYNADATSIKQKGDHCFITGSATVSGVLTS